MTALAAASKLVSWQLNGCCLKGTKRNHLPGTTILLLAVSATSPDNESQLVGNPGKYWMRAERCRSRLRAGSLRYIFICWSCGCLQAKCVRPQSNADADECWQPVNCHSARLPASGDPSGFFYFLFIYPCFAGLFTACRPWCIPKHTAEHGGSAFSLIKVKSSHAPCFCCCSCDASKSHKLSETPGGKLWFISCLEAHWLRIAPALERQVVSGSEHLIPSAASSFSSVV